MLTEKTAVPAANTDGPPALATAHGHRAADTL